MNSDRRQYLLNVFPFVRYPYFGEAIRCPCCGGEGVNILKADREMKPLQTDLCTSCGLFFTNPMPTDAELANYYKSMYRSAYMGAFKAVPKKHITKKKKDAERRADLIKSFLGNSQGCKTLDFGCGLGELVLAMEQRGIDAYGFEPGDVWSQHARSDRVQQGTWQSAQYDPGSFGLVSIIHVLEHLREPLLCLKKIENLLKPEGLLWIEVPDMQAYETKTRSRFHFAHVLGFSRDNLLSAAWNCGFFPIRTVTKEEIGKRRPQVSFVFRKRRPGDEISLDLRATVEKNARDYGGARFMRTIESGLLNGA